MKISLLSRIWEQMLYLFDPHYNEIYTRKKILRENHMAEQKTIFIHGLSITRVGRR